MNLFFTKQLKTIELYSLPIAAFFVLISTSAFNTFIILALIIGTFRIVYEKDYNNIIILIFLVYLIPYIIYTV